MDEDVRISCKIKNALIRISLESKILSWTIFSKFDMRPAISLSNGSLSLM